MSRPTRSLHSPRISWSLTARLGARADEDPFGNPVLLVALAITRRMDQGALAGPQIAGADPPLARRRLRRPCRPHRRLCRRRRYPGERRRRCCASRSTCCGPTRTTARSAGRNTAPWWSAPVSPPCSPRIPPSRCPRRSTTRWPKPPAADQRQASPRTVRRPSRSAEEFEQAGHRHRQRPRRDGPVQCRPADRRALRLARPLDRAEPAPGHPVHLGRLRHRRPHRYRLVGHAAAAAGDEAPAARPPARAARRTARHRPARRTASPRRWTRWPRSSPPAPTTPDPPRVAAFAARPGRAPRRRADHPGTAAAAVQRRRSTPPPTTTHGWRCASRAPGWCRTACRWRTPTRG